VILKIGCVELSGKFTMNNNVESIFSMRSIFFLFIFCFASTNDFAFCAKKITENSVIISERTPLQVIAEITDRQNQEMQTIDARIAEINVKYDKAEETVNLYYEFLVIEYAKCSCRVRNNMETSFNDEEIKKKAQELDEELQALFQSISNGCSFGVTQLSVSAIVEYTSEQLIKIMSEHSELVNTKCADFESRTNLYRQTLVNQGQDLDDPTIYQRVLDAERRLILAVCSDVQSILVELYPKLRQIFKDVLKKLDLNLEATFQLLENERLREVSELLSHHGYTPEGGPS